MWIALSNCEWRRVAEITLTVLMLLVVVSSGGAPMILLSTFSPSWLHWGIEEDVADEYEIEKFETSQVV